jgi:putative spermidine/putrescine transport system permease protein
VAEGALTAPTPLPAADKRRRLDLGYLPLLAPVLALLGLFFVLPMANLVVMSFYGFEPNRGIVYELGLGNYARFLGDPFYLGILGRTLKIAAQVTLMALLLAYPVAFYLSRTSGKERTYLTLLIVSPLLVSLVIRSFGWLIVLGPRGLINSTLRGWGIVESPLALMYTENAVLVSLIHVFYPFMVLPIAGSLQNIDPSVVRAAQNLGAGRWQVFRRVILPLSLPGVVAGCVIVFALTCSAFVTPLILGGPKVKVMAYSVWEQVISLLNWPFGAAIAFLLLFITLALIFAYNRWLESGRYAEVFR